MGYLSLHFTSFRVAKSTSISSLLAQLIQIGLIYAVPILPAMFIHMT